VKQGLIMLALLLLANVVAAGVMGQAILLLRETAPWTRDEWWPWVFVAAAGIACAIAFLRGAIVMLVPTSSTKRKKP
jgi:hypothetical protein